MGSKTKDKDEMSRRSIIRTLGFGLGLSTLPSFVKAEMTEIPLASLDPEERIIPLERRNLLEMEQFVEDCIKANKEANPQEAVKEVLARAVSNPSALLQAIGEPKEAGLKVFLRSVELTIFAATWTPQMNLMPHNHLMWANIGIYTGREDNIIWDRTNERLKSSGANCLFTGDAAKLAPDAIHSVTNPLPRFTGGLHIYGGDFFATARSQWDPETLEEAPSDGDTIRDIFRKANEQMRRIEGH